MTRFPTLCLGFCGAWLSVFALSAPSHADPFITGTQLAKACASRNPTDEQACVGYIAGVLDDATAGDDAKSGICTLPRGIKLSAMRTAMAKFAEQKPEETKGSGLSLVKALMKANYPCPTK